MWEPEVVFGEVSCEVIVNTNKPFTRATLAFDIDSAYRGAKSDEAIIRAHMRGVDLIAKALGPPSLFSAQCPGIETEYEGGTQPYAYWTFDGVYVVRRVGEHWGGMTWHTEVIQGAP